MILLADCGSTKVDWCVIDGQKLIRQVFTPGINPFFQTEEEISEQIEKGLIPQLEGITLTHVYFYGAGCAFPDVCNMVKRAIQKHIPADTDVESDLLAAARGLCGNNAGIACIMGTGSNSCCYDGSNIVDNVSPLGFILGDEGSGAVLGKRFIGDVLKNQLPKELCDSFLKEYELDRQKIIERVYKKPFPNRFLASLSPFICKNIEEPAVHRMVLNEFKSFFVRNILGYEGAKELKVGFVGSVAYYYADVLKEAAVAVGVTVGDIIKSPMEGLIKYHSQNN